MRGNLDPANSDGLIDSVGYIALEDDKARSPDILGHIFEYLPGEFALAQGKKSRESNGTGLIILIYEF